MRHTDRSAETGGAFAPLRVSLITNGVTWYLRSALESDTSVLHISTPRTLLGFLPIGTKQLDSDLNAVARAAIGVKVFPDRLLVAIALASIALLANLGTIGTVVLAIATVAMLLLSVIAVLRVELTDGSRCIVPVCLAHLGRAGRFADDLEARLGPARADEVP
ncbi:hypothetical protein ACFLRH_01855 [Actinomycetota bacterium]